MTSASPSAAGELVAGRYRLLRQLGAGAMGSVWRAYDERLQRRVALKRVLPLAESENTGELRERVLREGRIAARLQHPHAVAVYDVVEDDGSPVLVMEYLRSTTLAQLLASEDLLPVTQVADIGAQVASALAAAHEAGIVHRDVKPGNILMSDEGVKIGDFGIAHASGDATITATGVVAGTPAFLAPETVQGRPPLPRSDVFSLGATLYAAVEGVPPFGRDLENPYAVLFRIASGEMREPKRAGVLGPVLKRMMAPVPADRPTAEEAAEFLRAIANGLQLPPTRTLSLPRMSLRRRAHRQRRDARWQRAQTDAGLAVLEGGSSGAIAVGDDAPEGHEAAGIDVADDSGARTVADGSSGTLRVDGRESRARVHRPRVLWPPRAPAESRRARVFRARRTVFAGLAGVLATVAVVVFLLQAPGQTSTHGQPVAPISPEQLEKSVADYYALLPDRPQAAWERLAVTRQSAGLPAFRQKWDAVATLAVTTPPHADNGFVTVGIEETLKDGTFVRETHRIGFEGGLLGADTVLTSERTAPAPPPPATVTVVEQEAVVASPPDAVTPRSPVNAPAPTSANPGHGNGPGNNGHDGGGRRRG